jgi:hypothetical protein
MKVRLALLLSVCFVIAVAVRSHHVSAAANQIEHAPTPEQCRADADAWGIPTPALFVNTEQQFNPFTSGVAGARGLTANVLNARTRELSQCMRTDRPNSTRYAEANRAYAIAQLIRMENYMKRHDLISQFLAEDEQGQR